MLTKLYRLLLQLITSVVKFVAKVCYRGALHVFVHIDSTFKYHHIYIIVLFIKYVEHYSVLTSYVFTYL